MLVLVFQKCKRVLNSTFNGSIVACLMLVCSLATAQESESSRGLTPTKVKSVLEQNHLNPAANGSASIHNAPNANPQATFTARPLPKAFVFPDAPQPPRGILIPQSPTQDDFTNSQSEASTETDITFNNLRGADGVEAEVNSESTPDQDRSGAQGTFATSNQSWQNPLDGQNESSRGFQPLVPQSNQDAGSTERTFGPPIVSSFGDSQSRSENVPSRARSIISPQANTNIVSDEVEAKATPWRRESAEASFSSQGYPSNRVAVAQQQYGASAGAAFNANANSNYNRGVNPNIATGQLPPNQMGQLPPAQSGQNGQTGRIRSFNDPAMQTFQRDDAVTPSTFNQPLASSAKTTDLAKQLIARYSLDGLDPNQLPGQPVTLLEMLSQPISTEQRRPMVHQFWDTYFDWASLVNSQQYEALLSGIPSPRNTFEKAMLDTAREVAKNEVLASEIQLIKSQSKLRQFMPNRSANVLPPLPNELPLIKIYNTNYEKYEQYQLLPANLVGIDKMLPKTLELIIDRANTVQLAQSTNKQIRNGLATGQSSVSVVLDAAKLWRASEQSLLVAVTEYNHAIGDYALTVSRGYQPPAKVAWMLIGTRKPVANSNDVLDRFNNARNAQLGIQNQNGMSGSASLGQFGNNQPTPASSTNPNRISGDSGLFSGPPAGRSTMAPATPMGQAQSGQGAANGGFDGGGSIGGGFNATPPPSQSGGNRSAQGTFNGKF